jgi:hypothetical protein
VGLLAADPKVKLWACWRQILRLNFRSNFYIQICKAHSTDIVDSVVVKFKIILVTH